MLRPVRGGGQGIPLCDEPGIGYTAFSPLANGLLSGKYADDSAFEKNGEDYCVMIPQFEPENLRKNQPLVELLSDVADLHDATPVQISLAWMICKRPFIVPIPGTRKQLPQRTRERPDACRRDALLDLRGW